MDLSPLKNHQGPSQERFLNEPILITIKNVSWVLSMTRNLRPQDSWGWNFGRIASLIVCLVDQFWGEQQDCDGTSWGKSYYHQDLKNKN